MCILSITLCCVGRSLKYYQLVSGMMWRSQRESKSFFFASEIVNVSPYRPWSSTTLVRGRPLRVADFIHTSWNSSLSNPQLKNTLSRFDFLIWIHLTDCQCILAAWYRRSYSCRPSLWVVYSLWNLHIPLVLQGMVYFCGLNSQQFPIEAERKPLCISLYVQSLNAENGHFQSTFDKL